jgi:hypothetical protein
MGMTIIPFVLVDVHAGCKCNTVHKMRIIATDFCKVAGRLLRCEAVCWAAAATQSTAFIPFIH